MAPAKPSRSVILFGTDVADAKRRILTAGPISAMLDNGAIRSIRYRGVEVLRGVAYLIRDKNWGTYAPAVSGLKIRQSKTGFRVSYSATCKDKDQAITYEAAIEAASEGRVTFSATGTPLSDFITNRTGFVVLHPLAGVVGAPVDILHTDGRSEKSRFPKFISPGQPVFEIRALKHQVMPGVSATVLMEGNKFEMEDHRNWMDASYKTYVCSLLDPWPYTLKKGETFTQSITVTLSGKPAGKPAKSTGSDLRVTLGGIKGRLPDIGTGVAMAEAAAAVASLDLLAAAGPAHLVAQIDGGATGQAAAADHYRSLKEKTGAALTLEIILPAREAADKEMAAVAKALREGGLKPDAVVVTQAHDLKSFQPGTPRPWGPSFEEMAAAARASFPGVAVGGGMLSFFTELNRKRPAKGVFDFVTHTVCPIVHAADDLSVMETLESIPSIISSTRAFMGKTPYHLGPSSIPCRANPYGRAVTPNPGNGRLCLSDLDPRQRGLFGAAWSFGLLAAAARGGLDRMALGAATGPQGLIYRKASHVQPWFDGGGAAVYPAYHVLAGLAPLSGTRLIETSANAPTRLATLALKGKNGPILLLANLTGEDQQVKIEGFTGAAEVHRIDARNFAAAARAPDFLATAGTALGKVKTVELGPYALIRIRAA